MSNDIFDESFDDSILSFSFEVAETVLPDEEGLLRDIDGQLIREVKATVEDYEKEIEITIDGIKTEIKLAVPTTDSQGNIIRGRDGQTVPRRTTIYDAARQIFVTRPGDENPIPTLCHQEHMRPVGACRVCAVEVVKDGRREGRLVPACQHRCESDMVVHTVQSPDKAASQRVRKSVSLLLEMLASDHLRATDKTAEKPADREPNELEVLVEKFGAGVSRFKPRTNYRGHDDSSVVIKVDHEACILCDRCARACDDIKENLVIGRTGKGYTTRIGFDLNDPMGQSSCVSCGECMISCPTGALTFRGQVLPGFDPDSDYKPENVSRLTAAELRARSPLFAGIPYKFLQWNSSSVLLRKLKKGEVLCKEGEYGATAFILLTGKYEVSIRSLLAEVRNERLKGLLGSLGSITTYLSMSMGEQTLAGIRSDGGASLSPSKPRSIRTPDDLILGEMTCLSHYPRSATVTAAEDGEVLEIRRNVLHMLLRNPMSRALLNEVYRDRALSNQLLTSPIFQTFTADEKQVCIKYLSEKVELIRVDPGQTIFKQGERADHFYLVRLGFVKITQEFDGGERVLNYLGPGRHFGEIGLLSGLDELNSEHLPPSFVGRRSATCTALDDVELVRIRGEHFRHLVREYPELRERLIDESNRLLKSDEQSRIAVGAHLEEFLDQGLFNAQKLLVLDLERCTRCDECTKACADTHGGVTRLVREGLRFDKFLVASSCRSCLDPYCLVGCPVDAIHREHSLEIQIESHCIGCGLCADNCPYGNINMHGFKELRDDPTKPGRKLPVIQQKATTCDLCRHVVGPNEDPSCVFACPHNAAFRMSGPQLMQVIAGNR